MSETAVKERGIMFSAPMVRALLEGRKTQTRRVMPINATGNDSPQLRVHEGVVQQFVSAESATRIFRGPHDGGWITCVVGAGNRGAGHPLTCPYGVVGEHLWVRERFLIDKPKYVAEYKAEPWRGDPDRDNAGVHYFEHEEKIGCESIFKRWSSPIHMPRWACRIVLEITDVRVQRLQEINEVDAKAEGISDDPQGWDLARQGFAHLWQTINGKRYPWDMNPFVWAITFKRVES